MAPFRYCRIEVSWFAIRPCSRPHRPCANTKYDKPARPRTPIVAEQEPNTEELTTQLEATLRTVGIEDPEVTIRPVDAIARHAQTGKSRRFIPIGD